ncbi:MAG: PadR family transcriptional regulator [Demequinaceae bacterium]|nr:PadR family transcriptional regulator [Demequinaceae bacterium]
MPYGHGRGSGGGGRGGGHGGGHGGGGAGRGSLLEPAVLAALTTATSHGYDLRAEVEELTSGYLVVDPGGLYRTLRRMEDEGLVTSTWTEGEHGPQRRIYRLTADGREVLRSWAERLVARRTALDGILRAIDRMIGQEDPPNTLADSESTTIREEHGDDELR